MQVPGNIIPYALLTKNGVDPDPVAAMRDLLAQWSSHVRDHADPRDPDTEAVLTWPSRDTLMTRLFLERGLVPGAIIAARLAGRSSPTGDAPVRRMAAADVDAAVERWLEVVRWDAQFSSVTERPTTAGIIRRDLAEAVAGQRFWTWVAGADGAVDGLLMLDPPEHAGWIAPLVGRSPVAYLGAMGVVPDRRSAGIGAALVARAHAALDDAGVTVTLLHYGALNPLSGPFWHRCGYRPLWTIWEAYPASTLRTP
jgi:GNAT superfamily N-acetyltransferase